MRHQGPSLLPSMLWAINTFFANHFKKVKASLLDTLPLTDIQGNWKYVQAGTVLSRRRRLYLTPPRAPEDLRKRAQSFLTNFPRPRTSKSVLPRDWQAVSSSCLILSDEVPSGTSSLWLAGAMLRHAHGSQTDANLPTVGLRILQSASERAAHHGRRRADS